MSTTTKQPKKADPKAPAPRYQYREEWLTAALEYVRRLFEDAGYEVPENIRVTCGWPSRQAMSGKRRRIGECWSNTCSADGTHEIILSLYLADATEVVGVLIHEVAHAAVGVEHGHDKVFGRCARAVGLTGKLTATTITDDLKQRIRQWISDDLGGYPHARLDGARNKKAQPGSRLIKLECPSCDCVIRVTRKWIDEYGAFPCPCGGELTEPE